MEAVMVLLTRSLDLIAATILEATMVYTIIEFPDVLTPEAGFWAFVAVTTHLLWRVVQVGQSTPQLIAALARKRRRNLDLTLIADSVFSRVCYRKDG